MKKMRRIRDNWTSDDVVFLSQLGIKAKEGRMHFYIEEEDDRYKKILNHFEDRWNAGFYLSHDVFFYEYSKEEYETSDYFVIEGWNNCGYPQPEAGFKYESISFDAEKICPKCNCGRVQTNNLRVNKLSKHGFWTFFSWLIDEFFVSERIYNEVFSPYGIEKRNVIKGGKIVEGVYQLIIPTIDESIDLSDREREICPICGVHKYSMRHMQYPFFPLHKHPLPGIYKTKEYFGSGGQAQHSIIISKNVADKLIESKDLKREWLIPCRRADSNQ